MGGGIAQHLALDHADRVASLTVISTTPGRPRPPADVRRAPSSVRAAGRRAGLGPTGKPSDYIVEDLRGYAGSVTFNEEERRALAGRIVDRTANIESTMTNHSILEGGEPLRPRLCELTTPTLVFHGTEDPLFPYGHAEGLAAEIPGAKLVPLEGVGHEMPPRPVWDRVVAAVFDRTG